MALLLLPLEGLIAGVALTLRECRGSFISSVLSYGSDVHTPLCPKPGIHITRKGIQMNIEVSILAVAILLLAVLAYGKELLVSLATLFRTSRQHEEDVHSFERE